jgi:tRNA A37 threonylcarbamoyladenosine dehydratase
MRNELRRAGIRGVRVVYSEEAPIPRHPAYADYTDDSGKRGVPGSISFVPSSAGLLLASEAVQILLK